MNAVQEIERRYRVQARKVWAQTNAYAICYSPRSLSHERGSSGVPKKAQLFKASLQTHGQKISVHWEDHAPVDTQVTVDDFNEDARCRARILHEWLENLGRLIESVGAWAAEVGWATKQIEKPMEDSEIGKYEAPALLLQQNTVRLMMEPIGRSCAGADGVVELYRMPAYDDIASIYYYDKRWNLHYFVPRESSVAMIRGGESKPLTKASLRKVLDEMEKNAH